MQNYILYFFCMPEITLMSAQNEAMGMARNVTNTGESIISQILDILGGVFSYAKPVIAALLIIIIGGFIIKKIMGLLQIVLEKAKIDALFEKIRITSELQNLGITVTPAALITGIIGLVAKFILWMAAINTLGIDALTKLMNDILAYIPNILIALILLFAGLTIAKITKETIEQSASSLSVSSDTATLFGKIAKISILIITAMAVLTQLHIAVSLIETLFSGFVAMMAIAGGIAFGFGGQEKAKAILEKLLK